MEQAIPTYQASARHIAVDGPITFNPLLDDPQFLALVHSRRTFSWSLTIVMLLVYFAFILTLAFSPALLGQPLVEGYPMTLGIPVGFGMFVFTFMLVLVYVVRANTAYDRAISQIRMGASQ